MSDFINGLQSADEYLNRTVSVPTDVTVAEDGTITSSTTTYTIREIICSLLAGNGLRLPNIQICLKINLGRLIPEIPEALAELRQALEEAERALEEFIAHTDIENVLNRLNSAIAEFAAVANMINFCGTPIVPRAIPNVLADTFGSFTGAGKDLLDSLGVIANSDIGGCVGADGRFNPDIFTSGLLKDIGDNFNNLQNLPANLVAGWTATANGFKNDLENLMKFENTLGNGSFTSGGGSNFAPDRINFNVGVGIDTANMDIMTAQRLGHGLKSSYDSLKGYEVDGQGNNIFYYLLEPELIAKLDNNDPPVSNIVDQVPVYDYCGQIIGYSEVPIQSDSVLRSSGLAASVTTQPGLANIGTSGAVIFSPTATTTNLASSGTTNSSISSGTATDADIADALASLKVVQNPPSGSTGTLVYDGTNTFTFTPAVNSFGSLATVATSGNYNDLSNTPTIPTNNNQLTNGAGYISSVPAQTFTSLTGKPTTIAGYGITDAVVDFADLGTTPTTLAGYGITDAATSAQGALADSALQAETITLTTLKAEVAASVDFADFQSRIALL